MRKTVYYIVRNWATITQHTFANDSEAIAFLGDVQPKTGNGLDKTDGDTWHEYDIAKKEWKKKTRSRSMWDAESAVKDMLNAHEIYKGTWSALTMKTLYLRKRFNLSGYDWRYLDGYIRARIDTWYRQNLRFGYDIDGTVYWQNWDTMSEEHRELARQNKLVSAHYWVNDKGEITSNKW